MRAAQTGTVRLTKVGISCCGKLVDENVLRENLSNLKMGGIMGWYAFYYACMAWQQLIRRKIRLAHSVCEFSISCDMKKLLLF